MSLAFIAMKRQDWVRAERLLRDAMQMGHRALTAKHHLAMVQLRLGNPVKLYRCFDQWHATR